jgi:hypothetical protein
MFAVEEQRGDADHAVAERAHGELLDASRVRVLLELALEARYVESDARGQRDEPLDRVLVGMQEQLAVHLPELTLGGGGLRGFGCLLGEAVLRAARHVPVDEEHLTAMLGPHLLELRVCLDTVGALEVRVLDQHHRCVTGTIGVIVVVDFGNRQHGCSYLGQKIPQSVIEMISADDDPT